MDPVSAWKHIKMHENTKKWLYSAVTQIYSNILQNMLTTGCPQNNRDYRFIHNCLPIFLMTVNFTLNIENCLYLEDFLKSKEPGAQ